MFYALFLVYLCIDFTLFSVYYMTIKRNTKQKAAPQSTKRKSRTNQKKKGKVSITMLTLKINYENGDSRHTRINATLAEAKAYYIGKIFNIGIVSDDLQKCTSIDILEDDSKPHLNSMCINCLERGKTCNGTTCQVWTGCIYRKTK